MSKDWIFTVIFKKTPYKLEGFKENEEYKWVKKEYSEYQDLYIHRSAISRFLLPHINGLSMSTEIESNINLIIADILNGHIQVSNLEVAYSVDQNSYQMDSLFLHLKFNFEGTTLYLNAYGWGVDIHKLDVGFGKHAIVKRFKVYSWGEHRYSKYAPMSVAELKQVIEKQKQDIIREFGDEPPDKEIIEANRESLEKRFLGESLGLEYNSFIDDFE